eukprot:NODE_40_length_35084_cov_0.543519.p4 type:complete len:903 gc:universal NODE_40_length_35084_cov_0.543519:20800-18092(-)
MDSLKQIKNEQYALSLLSNKEKFVEYVSSFGLNGENIYNELSLKTYGEFSVEDENTEDPIEDLLLEREWYGEDAFDVQQHPYSDYERTRKTQRQKFYEQEQDKWEQNRLATSGVRKRKDELEDEGEKHHLIVHDDVPEFLKNSTIKEMDMISVVKDPKSDMSVLARKGSKLVSRKREEQEVSKLSSHNLDGTMMGKISGQKSTFEVVKEEKKFLELMENQNMATSEFALKKSIQQQRKYLPIFAVRRELMQLIRENQILVIVGETGSGKTTQLAQYLYEVGFARHGMIGVTQPRRVAALSVAKRVSDEMGVALGEEVGYSIRFEDQTSSKTKIKFMTDGILLRECLKDSDVDQYSVIILDEAHERNLNTDVLMGVLKRLSGRRLDFKLIVTSATMNAGQFSQFFSHSPIYNIPGRTFPVEIMYSKTPTQDYVESAVKQALTIHLTMGPGDILLFLTGQEDIEAACFAMKERLLRMEDTPELDILPIYSQLPADMQAKIFMKSKNRKVIVATNIAETSLTIDGIKYTVDSGFCKLKVFNPRLGIDTLQVTPISQANANQRSGRAGRTTNGFCYRLYTEIQFEKELLSNTIPEIQRTNLANVILLLKSLNIDDIFKFDFMDSPSMDSIRNSLHQLWLLGAIDDKQNLTEIGRLMVEFPLEPSLAKMVVMGIQLGCLEEVLVIVSMLSVPHVFYRPKERAEEADSSREKFYVPESDHLTLLNIYSQFLKNGQRDSWCLKHFLHPKPIRKAKEINFQLVELIKKANITITSCGSNLDLVRKSICSAYFHHTARMKSLNEYMNARSGVSCFLHPTSSLSSMGALPDYIVYHELLYTSKEYMQTVTSVDPLWLAELGPQFFSVKNHFVEPFEFTFNLRKEEKNQNPFSIEFEAQKSDGIQIRKKKKRY